MSWIFLCDPALLETQVKDQEQQYVDITIKDIRAFLLRNTTAAITISTYTTTVLLL